MFAHALANRRARVGVRSGWAIVAIGLPAFAIAGFTRPIAAPAVWLIGRMQGARGRPVEARA
jgi:hypothetical protein